VATDTKWKPISLTDDVSLKVFISESRYVLDQLATDVKSRLSTVAAEISEAANDFNAGKQKYASIVSILLDKLRGGPGTNLNEIAKLETGLREIEAVLLDADLTQIELLKPSMSTTAQIVWDKYIREIEAVISGLRERDLLRVESRRIRAAYLVWLGRYRLIEGKVDESDPNVEKSRQQAFAEQVSYVFFVRLVLACVLEDKGMMRRLVSDGGFSAWYDFLKLYHTDSIDELRSSSFLPLVYRRVAGFYHHFFQQPVFDWFVPDDYLVVLVLSQLNKYSFKEVTSDILGFTYEAFIDRFARNKKGHFLTPPSVVDFMLDRIEYNTASIIGESLLDPACGSGSFLVHAARRLRQVLASAMVSHSPVELAERFIEQVTTKLVGLEINPFSCYLAELNLFIQILDDLDLLWRNNKRIAVERFAVFNTNSLEMPQEVLYSDRDNSTKMLLIDDTALDEASSIKSLQSGFNYVICNPPYINRGIILDAKSYRDFPFYAEIVKGDENFYLLFLRLADYYVSLHGTICFICPLNLVGDESAMRAREIFSGEDWSIKSITRFYARDVHFPGVLQGICVVRFDKTPREASDLVEIRGGYSIEEAVKAVTHIHQPRCTHSYLNKHTWNKPWLVNSNLHTYDLWEFIKNNSIQDLSELIQEKIKVKEGDARSTWAKPMLVSGPRPHTIPLTKGENIVDWGGWSVEAYLDPSLKIPVSLKDYKSCLWVQEQVKRITNLSQTETVIFLKEVSGLEMKRPIRGTIIQRDQQHPVVADHTVLVMYTLDAKYEDLAYAIFGLLTSSTYNFLFSLFSTNAHVNFKEILRLPVPVWSQLLEKNLARITKEALAINADVYSHEKICGTGQDRQNVSINDVLKSTGLQTLSLEELVLRRDIEINGSENYRLGVLLQRGKLEIRSGLDREMVRAIESILHANGNLTYAKEGKNLCFPHPKVASRFLSQLELVEKERLAKINALYAIQLNIDDIVMDAYGISKAEWEEIIKLGVPWARGRNT